MVCIGSFASKDNCSPRGFETLRQARERMRRGEKVKRTIVVRHGREPLALCLSNNVTCSVLPSSLLHNTKITCDAITAVQLWQCHKSVDLATLRNLLTYLQPTSNMKPRDYCCCAIPIINAGIYITLTEQFVVALLVGILSVATPFSKPSAFTI